MRAYDLEELLAGFPASDGDLSRDTARLPVSDDYELETAASLGLPADSPLRRLIEEPKGEDRSGDVMACAAMMVRMGYDDAAILGILLNPTNAVSAHCLAQKNGFRAAARAIQRARASAPPAPPGSDAGMIEAKLFVWRDPTSLPERPWVYGRLLLRGSVTAIVSPGGLGKTTLNIGTALALVSGRSLFGHKIIKGPHRVWLWNLEDSGDELERAISGAIKHWGLTPEDLGERLFVNSGLDGDRLCIATQTRDLGPRITEPVVEALKSQIRERRIDVLIIDPFVSSHMVSENDNMAVDMVVKQWSAIAAELGCAVVLVHHTRKVNGQTADAEAARGASALVNAARAVLVLNRMTEKEAKSYAIPPDEIRFYFRVTADKQNRAPPSKADWYKLEGVMLENGPHGGDSVGVVVPWNPPDAVASVSLEVLAEVQRRADEGSFRESDRAVDWIGHMVADVLDVDISNPAAKRRIKLLIATWIAAGDLMIRERYVESRKKTLPFVISGVRM